MAPLPPAAQVVRIALTGTNQTHPWANIIHMKYVGSAPTTTDLDALCNTVATAWQSAFAALLSTTTSLRNVVAQDLTSPSSSNGSFATNHPGTLVATDLPVNVAMVITWRANMRWRGGHPRTYLTGLSQAQIVGGNSWATTTITAFTTAAQAFHNSLNAMTIAGASWSHVVLRRHQTLPDGTSVPLDPPLPVPITAGVVDNRVDSQRRRLGPDVPA